MKRLGSGPLFFIIAVSLRAEDISKQVRSLYESDRWTDAVSIAQSSSDTSADTLFYEGLALARFRKLYQAEQVFRHGLESYPADKRFSLELAGVAYRMKETESAKSFLQRALRLDPGDQYGNDFIATIYLLDGNLPAALKYWNRIGKPSIQDVQFAPVPRLDPVLRERVVAISGGQILTLKRLFVTEANLARLDIFSDDRFELTPRNDQRYNLTVRLTPISQPFAGWLGRLLPVVRSLPYQGLNLDRYNIRDRAINFTSLVRWDVNKRRFAAELSGPIRLKPESRYRFLVDLRDENWDLSRTYQSAGSPITHLALRKAEFGGDAVFAFSENLQWTTGVRAVRRWFKNDDGNSAFASGWSFDQVNELKWRLFTWPEKRINIDTAALLRTGRILTGAQSSFAMLESEVSATWLPQTKGDTWQAHARFRGGPSFGAVPFDEFFQLGMERDNDLWLRGHLGTRDGRKGNAPLGTNFALAQIDVDRTIFHTPFVTVSAGPFFDAGWISGPSNQFGSQGWVPDTGLQAKVKTVGRLTVTLVYGRDLKGGRGAFYTAVSR